MFYPRRSTHTTLWQEHTHNDKYCGNSIAKVSEICSDYWKSAFAKRICAPPFLLIRYIILFFSSAFKMVLASYVFSVEDCNDVA